MICETDSGGFVISSRRMWIPGVYATREAARYAFQFDWSVLQELTDRICHVDREWRTITIADLREAKAGLTTRPVTLRGRYPRDHR